MRYTIINHYGFFPRGDFEETWPTKEELLRQAQVANRYKRLGIYGQEYETYLNMDYIPELDSPSKFSNGESFKLIIFDVSNG